MCAAPNSIDVPSSRFCFVIGPIGREGTPERKHSDLVLHILVRYVLTNDIFQYRVKRADEDADPGMIGDRIINDLIEADLVVAVLTDLNPNVFYELGIRHSVGKPTIHIARMGTALPFDNIQHRTIFVDLTDWRSIEEARARLAESIRVTAATGYKVSNPITQARTSLTMQTSDDARDRMLAEIKEQLESAQNSRPPLPAPRIHLDFPLERFDRRDLFIAQMDGAIPLLKSRESIRDFAELVCKSLSLRIDDLTFKDSEVIINVAITEDGSSAGGAHFEYGRNERRS